MKQENKRGASQVSAGGVVYRVGTQGVEFCMIGRRRNTHLVWCLPKGHVEDGESLEKTALREVREETGLVCDIIREIGPISYSFKIAERKNPIFKTVHFFLMHFQTGSVDDHDDEVERVEWVSMDDAMRRACYAGEKGILKRAKKQIETLK